MKATSVGRGSTVLKLANCLLLLLVGAILIYDVKMTSEVRHTAENEDTAESVRNKREVVEVTNGAGNKHTVVKGGAMYTRWGRSTCEGDDVQLLYAGVVGGSHYDHHGGGSNYLCMPPEPEWGRYSDAVTNHAIIYGAEYELQGGEMPFETQNGQKLQNHNVPCAVCRVPSRSSVLMIPAKNKCLEGWTPEYGGYLMAGHHLHKGRFEFVCMDENPEADPAGFRDENGALFYSSEGACGSLPCPPYIAGRELTCVVCTK